MIGAVPVNSRRHSRGAKEELPGGELERPVGAGRPEEEGPRGREAFQDARDRLPALGGAREEGRLLAPAPEPLLGFLSLVSVREDEGELPERELEELGEAEAPWEAELQGEARRLAFEFGG